MSTCSFLHWTVPLQGGEIGAEDRHGWSALHYAVRYASIDTVSFLLDRGANIHRLTQTMKLEIMLAVSSLAIRKVRSKNETLQSRKARLEPAAPGRPQRPGGEGAPAAGARGRCARAAEPGLERASPRRALRPA